MARRFKEETSSFSERIYRKFLCPDFLSDTLFGVFFIFMILSLLFFWGFEGLAYHNFLETPISFSVADGANYGDFLKQIPQPHKNYSRFGSYLSYGSFVPEYLDASLKPFYYLGFGGIFFSIICAFSSNLIADRIMCFKWYQRLQNKYSKQ